MPKKSKLHRHTVSVKAKNKREAVKKLRKLMLPGYRNKFTPEKVKLRKEVRTYEVTWRPRKTTKKRRKK